MLYPRRHLFPRLAAALLLASGGLALAVPAHAGPSHSTPATPAPAVTTLSPTTAVAGSAGFTLTVTGTNFTAASVVYFGETPLATTENSATQLSATLPTTALARTRTVSVVVLNGRGGGGQSNVTSFSVTPSSPAPTVSSLSPTTAVAGSAGFTLTVNGANFLSTSSVYLGQTALATTFGSAAQLTATVPASAVARAGTLGVVVSNGPSSGYSSPTLFTVTPANAPTVSSLSPTSATVGGAQFTLTVNGTNFLSSSVVYFGDRALATTFVTATQLNATVPAAVIASPRTTSVVVYNGRGGGGQSNVTTFTVTPSATSPTITLLSPNTAVAGGAGFTLAVTGTNFVSASVVSLGRLALATTFVDAAHLMATVPASALDFVGTLPVVVNDGAGIGISASVPFTVTPPPAGIAYELARRGSATSAGVAGYELLTPTTAPDFTQPLTVTLTTAAATSSPSATLPFYQTAALTLTPETYTPRGGTAVTYYQYQSAALLLVVSPQANGQYLVEWQAQGVNLSDVALTAPVTVAVAVGGQTFTATATPQSASGRD